MISIYSQAHMMAMWLGPEAKNSNLAIDLMHELLRSRESPAKIREIINSPRHRAKFQALVAIFERDYWDRLWVVQEVMNAKKITVYCGKSALPWESYEAVLNLLKQNESDLIRSFLDIVAPSEGGHAWAVVLAQNGPRMLRNLQRADGSSPGLLDALAYHRSKSCAEPRDKVYALLGILSRSERSQFPVDYDISTREVYINIVDYLLTTTRRLDVICASFHFPKHPSIERLPSWAPNWSHDQAGEPLGRRFPGFSAAGSTDAQFAFSNRRSRLQISAIFIDNIASCGMRLAPLISMGAVLMVLFQWRLKLIQNKGCDLREQEAFCRTLCCDQTHDRWAPREWLEWTYYAFATLLQERFPAMELDPQLAFYVNNSTPLSKGLRQQLFSDYIIDNMSARRFFITASGLLCLGSGAAQSSDIICVPLGCSTPIILRQQSQGYTYVGDVYVDGYMYGRAINELNNGTRQLQTFVIH